MPCLGVPIDRKIAGVSVRPLDRETQSPVTSIGCSSHRTAGPDRDHVRLGESTRPTSGVGAARKANNGLCGDNSRVRNS